MAWLRTLSPVLGCAALVAISLSALSGCIILDLAKVRETERQAAQFSRVAGTVTSDLPEATWIVVYVSRVPCDDDWRALSERVHRGEVGPEPASWSPELRELAQRVTAKASIAEHIVLQRPGFWYAELAPGCYGVGAFADLNRNFRYDDEPVAAAARRPDRLFELAPGDRREGIELAIDPDARLLEEFDPVALQVRSGDLRSHQEQLLVSLRQVMVEGDVVDLSDPRFAEANGRLGYFQIFRFLWEVQPGIFFLEAYDEDRVPVLFIHGAVGTPQSFETLIEGLDRTRFQPWVFYYPSGARLETVGEELSRVVRKLQLRLDFEDLVVVAYSMGGLVAREFVLRNHETVVDDPIRLFVSFVTPWAGVHSAQTGASRSPFVVPSWRDVAPNSDFLKQLFYEEGPEGPVRRPLPEQVGFHLLFGTADVTVPIQSATRWEALRDAESRWPLHYDHVEILRSPEAVQLLNELLARKFDG